MRLSEIERFWSKVKKQGLDDCWLWSGCVNNCDYGYFRVKNKNVGAHRYMYELKYGKIAKDIKVCHRCDNPPCVNPKHLFLGTQKDNLIDMFNKKRNPNFKGEKRGFAKLKDDQVLKIRDLYQQGVSVKVLALMNNVTKENVYAILSKRSWTHI